MKKVNLVFIEADRFEIRRLASVEFPYCGVVKRYDELGGIVAFKKDDWEKMKNHPFIADGILNHIED